MEVKEILARIGYVRNSANLSARELSLRIGMSSQYISKVERGLIVLNVEKLLKILEVCNNFPIDRFFSSDIVNYKENDELMQKVISLPENKKKNLLEFLR